MHKKPLPTPAAFILLFIALTLSGCVAYPDSYYGEPSYYGSPGYYSNTSIRYQSRPDYRYHRNWDHDRDRHDRDDHDRDRSDRHDRDRDRDGRWDRHDRDDD